ncbi:MAG: hypothetical protein QHI38_07780 [Armatimonadota bacterium]|nr:hypothetical protein [Armatimonadota bacterium]
MACTFPFHEPEQFILVKVPPTYAVFVAFKVTEVGKITLCQECGTLIDEFVGDVELGTIRGWCQASQPKCVDCLAQSAVNYITYSINQAPDTAHVLNDILLWVSAHGCHLPMGRLQPHTLC